MSEQNILNPVQGSVFGPDWAYSEGLPEMFGEFRSQLGKMFRRQLMLRGRVYDLQWNGRDKATMHTLRQWAEQYRNDFFSLQDFERSRYFSGRFDGELAISPVGNEQWNVRARFIELPGLAMYAYPSNWARDAAIFEERNGFGEDLVKLTGTWVDDVNALHHGGKAYLNANTNTSDKAEWIYFGYGFRLWAPKRSSWGILSLSATRVRDASSIVAATDVDLYAAADTAAAVLFTQTNSALDLYRVTLTATNRKNISSSANYIFADAIEVMR